MEQKAYEEDVMAYRHERAIASQRALMRQIKAHFAWAKSRHLLIGPAGVWSSQALLPHLEPREPERQDGSNNSKEGWTIEGFQDKVAWTIDSFQDSLHLRRRRVPMPKPLSLDAPQQR